MVQYELNKEVFYMSRISSDHKLQNTNNRLITGLQEVLQYCKTYGHQPAQNSELMTVVAKTQVLFRVRKEKKIPIPNEMIALYKKIKTFPTEKSQKRKDELFKLAAKKTARKNAYQNIQNLTLLDLKILKYVCGKEKFDRFVNTDIDIMATKAFLEFFEKLFNKTCGKREIIMIELLSGSRKDSPHWTDVKKCSDKDLALIAKYKKGKPLTIEEISKLFSLNYENVRKIVKNALDELCKPKTNFVRLLDVYLSGDAKAFMAMMPSKKTEMYKYQKNMNLQDIPSGVLNSVGKKLMAFFGKEKH